MNKGKLIVITGPDGCGKATQAKLLRDKFEKSGYKTESIDFPQYKNNFFGKMVGRYLSGEFGDPVELNPYLASMLYAGDRFESMRQIESWLDEGKIVVCDRYVGDNFLHQGSKIEDKAKREVFFLWLAELEYSVYGSFAANQTFYLDVPLEISLALLEKKEVKERKDYTGGKKDGHENEKHLREVRKIKDSLASRFCWTRIPCFQDGRLLSREEITDIIWSLVKTS